MSCFHFPLTLFLPISHQRLTSFIAPLVRTSLIEEEEADDTPTAISNEPSPPRLPTGLDALVAILKNADNKYPAELQANCCSFLAALGVGSSSDSSKDLEKISITVSEPLKNMLATEGISEVVLRSAAKLTASSK